MLPDETETYSKIQKSQEQLKLLIMPRNTQTYPTMSRVVFLQYL
jgi:hypothetical protein